MIVTLSGTIERIYTTSVEGFVRLRISDLDTPVIGGNLQALREEDAITFIGRKDVHAKYGPQIKIVKWWLTENCPFDNTAGKGVAASFQYLTETLGLTSKKAEDILLAYPVNLMQVIEENPYRLVTDGLVSRITVKFIDEKIAPHFKIDPQDQRRLKAAILEAIERSRSLYGLELFEDESGEVHGSAGGGHTYIDMTHLVCHVSDHMGISRKLVRDEVIRLANTPRNSVNPRPLISIDKDEIGKERFVYRYALHRAEKGLGHRIKHLLLAPIGEGDTIANLKIVPPDTFTMTSEQLASVKMALGKRLSIITGGPGTGKTTIITAVTDTLKIAGLQAGKDFHMCAFTGVAARKMEAATGCKASTIHRLLEYNPSRKMFSHNQNNPLATRYVICDEASMIAMGLLSCLFDAIPSGARVLLVGDADQLSPIDAGSPFKDLVNWGKVPTTRLNKIHRQDLIDSHIIQGSRKILERKIPTFAQDATGDLFMFPYKKDQTAINIIMDLMTKKIPSTFGIPTESIQIICPLKKENPSKKAEEGKVQSVRMLSTQYINKTVQEKLTKKLPLGARFNVGDRVIHTKNNYDLEVMNGEIGYVEHVANKSTKFPKFEYLVRYSVGRTVNYAELDIEQLELAYALTIHKMQGSEFPAVIVLAYSWGKFFTREMLYTAVTRGKRVVAMISPAGGKAFAQILKVDETKRNSRLIWRIENEDLSHAEFDEISVEELSADEVGV